MYTCVGTLRYDVDVTMDLPVKKTVLHGEAYVVEAELDRVEQNRTYWNFVKFREDKVRANWADVIHNIVEAHEKKLWSGQEIPTRVASLGGGSLRVAK